MNIFASIRLERRKANNGLYVRKVSCLLKKEEVISYEQYLNQARPYDIYIRGIAGSPFINYYGDM